MRNCSCVYHGDQVTVFAICESGWFYSAIHNVTFACLVYLPHYCWHCLHYCCLVCLLDLPLTGASRVCPSIFLQHPLECEHRLAYLCASSPSGVWEDTQACARMGGEHAAARTTATATPAAVRGLKCTCVRAFVCVCVCVLQCISSLNHRFLRNVVPRDFFRREYALCSHHHFVVFRDSSCLMPHLEECHC